MLAPTILKMNSGKPWAEKTDAARHRARPASCLRLTASLKTARPISSRAVATAAADAYSLRRPEPSRLLIKGPCHNSDRESWFLKNEMQVLHVVSEPAEKVPKLRCAPGSTY